MSAPSQQDLRDAGRAEMALRRPDLSIAPGSPEDVNLASQTGISDLAVQYAAQGLAGLFLDTARGDDLSLLGDDRTRLQRNPATPAIGTATFSPVSGTATGTIPIGTRVASAPDDSGAFITALTDVPLSFLAESAKNVTITTVDTGRAASVPPGGITRILDDLFQPFTVNNAEGLAGGADQESDAAYRTRVRGFPRTIAKATLRALAQGALGVPQVAKVSVTEEASGLTTVHVSDVQGLSSGAMVAAVAVELDTGGPNNIGWRAASQCVAVVGGSQLFQDVNVSLKVRTGVSIPTLVDVVQSAISNFMDTLNQGAILYRDAIGSAAKAVDPRNIDSVTVNVPAVDLVPDPSQAIRAGVVSVS